MLTLLEQVISQNGTQIVENYLGCTMYSVVFFNKIVGMDTLHNSPQ